LPEPRKPVSGRGFASPTMHTVCHAGKACKLSLHM